MTLASLDLLLLKLCPNDAAQLLFREWVSLVAVQLRKQFDVRDSKDEWIICCCFHIYIIPSSPTYLKCSTWNIAAAEPRTYLMGGGALMKLSTGGVDNSWGASPKYRTR